MSFLRHIIRKDDLEGCIVTRFVDGNRARGRLWKHSSHTLQDDEQGAIGDDMDGEEERNSVEMVCAEQSMS